MAIGTKPICESDRKVHWFASENLFIRTIILCFIKILTLFHEKQSDIVKFHVVLKIHAKKHLEIRDFCFFTKLKVIFSFEKNIF